MNNNNQGGNNNSTAFSAYNAQKNSAKTAANNAMLNKGMDAASKAIPALKAAKPIVNMAAQNAAMRKQASENINEDGLENGEDVNNIPKPNLKSDVGSAVGDMAKEKIKAAVKSFILKNPWVIIGIVATVLFVLGMLLIITVGIEYADQLADKVIYTSESTLNFATGYGFNSNIDEIQDRIDASAKKFGGIDRGILNAIVNNAAYVSTTVYEEDEPSDSEKTAFDAAKNVFIDKYSTHAFYAMKLDMLGSTGDAGSIIYSLMGEKIEYECVDPKDYSVSDNIKALSKYLYNGLLTAKDVAVTGMGKNITFLYGAGQLRFYDNVLSYANQGANYFETHYNELINLIDNLPPEAIKNDWQSIKDASSVCAAKYATNANGTYRVDPKTGKYVTLKAQYKTVGENDYRQLYNYIKKVYTPTLYNSIWNTLTAEKKLSLANEVWDDIVASRNSFYINNGINNILTYSFDEYGNIIPQATISYSGTSMGSVPTSEAAQVALSWKQGVGPWADDPMADPPIYTCGKNDNLLCSIGMVGCFVTSVSKLIAISGTQILTDTFDPGMFVDTLIHSNPPGLIDNMFYGRGWESIAPNFKRVGWIGLDNRSFSGNSGLISAYVKSTLDSAGYVGTGYYYVFLVNYGDGHTHYIAIVGENENGELLVSDPGGGPATPYSIEEVGKYYSSAKIGGISVYYASDVGGAR